MAHKVRPSQVYVRRNGPMNPHCTIIAAPGILVKDQYWTDPVRAMVSDGVAVHTLFSGPGAFDAQAVINGMVETAQYVHDGPITLFGASLGGMLLPAAAHVMIKRGIDPHRLRMVMVDSPYGLDTMSQVPGFARPLVRRVLDDYIPSLATENWANRHVMPRFAAPPKRDEITIPPVDVQVALAGRGMYSEAWKDWVRKRAKSDLLGNSFALWATQIAWMDAYVRHGSLERTVHTATRNGVDMHYVACTGHNVTVRQPLAMQRWEEAARPVLYRHEVPATHCGYLQYWNEFQPVLTELLDR